MKFNVLTLTKSKTALLFLIGSNTAFSQFRAEMPVVLSGDDLGSLQGLPVDRVVGFRWVNDNWQQIPIQIDERHWKTAFDLYGKDNIDPMFDILDLLAYADENTYSGSDEDTSLDGNDELVFMAYTSGNKYNGEESPNNTIGEPYEVALTDVLSNSTRYVYFFEQDGSYNLSAGMNLVDYDYNLLAPGPFKDAYVLNDYNPEDSYINTDYYQQHYSDDWLRDGLTLKTGNTPDDDLLDYHKNQFNPGNCARHPGTFSAGSGMHVASFDGPIRAVRSWIGANSGNLITRTHFFYEQMDEVVTNFRVHSIRSFMGYFDFSTKAAGMTWYNEHNLEGFAVDGNPDPVDTTYANWSLMAGEQGSILINNRIESNFPVDTIFSYYSDQANSPIDQCIGDQNEVAAHGWWIGQRLPNTDPRLDDDNNKIDMILTNFYLGQDETPSSTAYLRDYLAFPLLINEVSSSVGTIISPSVEALTILPNPVQDQFRISYGQGETGILEIFSLEGKLLWQDTVQAEEWISTPTGIQNGMYLVRFSSDHGVATGKVLFTR